mmetsp:Transcript_46992/g.78012  ORF Transcript_46992/g.78012 Transcript_46992/m.78012 type:complete len:173 (+) Transcript_46992:2-520(+)
MRCALWYIAMLYFLIWRCTFSESYGNMTECYQRYERCAYQRYAAFGFAMQCVIVVLYIVMPSGYMYFANFHRELHPKILILLNTAVHWLLFVVFLYVFNRHLDGHHHEKIIQYDMDDAHEDVMLIAWQVILSIAWLVYALSLFMFHREGTKQLEEQLETLIPTYDDEPPPEY